jgi:hypothetical protein
MPNFLGIRQAFGVHRIMPLRFSSQCVATTQIVCRRSRVIRGVEKSCSPSGGPTANHDFRGPVTLFFLGILAESVFVMFTISLENMGNI